MDIINAETVQSLTIESSDYSQSDGTEIPSEYLKMFNHIKNKKLHYDQDKYFYSSKDINIYLLQKFKSRIIYYKKKNKF